MNIQIAKKPITETESDQASPDLANEYSLAMQKANHRNCVQSQWGKSVSKKCVQRVCPKNGSPNDNTLQMLWILMCVAQKKWSVSFDAQCISAASIANISKWTKWI